MSRAYNLGKRAEQQAKTRRRIVEAAVELHGALGPARTSLSMVAERAGVQRNTFYAHFPDERSLAMACSALSIERNPPPMVQGRRLKIRYATQARTRPPTFALFANKPGERMPDSYVRYLDAGLRKEFGLEGVPLRFFVRHGDNPFDQG